MNTFEWTLNCTLLGRVLLRNLGTKPVNARILTLPVVLVAVACAFYLRSIPTTPGQTITVALFCWAQHAGRGREAARPQASADAACTLLVVGPRPPMRQWVAVSAAVRAKVATWSLGSTTVSGPAALAAGCWR